MVFFVCNHCGESVKKISVEKHYNTRCRQVRKNLSCMDCQKSFADDYVEHKSCISEAEKYSAKGFVPKEPKNTNAKKQESWMDIVRSILHSSEYKLDGKVRAGFQKIEHHDNVPRKKAKFQNFVSNCLHLPNQVSNEMWNVLEKELQKMKEARQEELQKEKQEKEKKRKLIENDKDEEEVPVKRVKKESSTEESKVKEKEPKVANGKSVSVAPISSFKFKEVITNIIAKEKGGIIELQKLVETIMEEYKKAKNVKKLPLPLTEEFTQNVVHYIVKWPKKRVEGQNIIFMAS